MPTVSPSASLSTKAYSRVISDVRVTAPSLSDREASAKELADLCESLLGIEKDKARRARLHLELARVHETTLDDLNLALTNFQKAHALDPLLDPATAGLARVRARLGQWEGVLAALEHQAGATARPEAQAAILFSKATILEMRLDRAVDARADYERALALMPAEASLLSSVVRCARRDQDWKGLDALLASQAMQSGSDHQLAATRMAERARIAEIHRKQSADAANFYQEALEVDPMASAAVLALERLLCQKKRHEDQVKLLRLRAELLKDAAGRSAALAAASEILVQSLARPVDAAAVLELAWEAQPQKVSLLWKLAELYRESGNDEGHYEALDRIAQRSENDNEQASLCIRIAEHLRTRLNRAPEAIRYLEKAREIAPTDPGCVQPLCAYYQENSAWGELIQVLSDEEAESGDTERRAEAHSEIARVCEYHLASPDDAISHYQAALGLTPEALAPRRALVRLLESAGRYEEVIEITARAADSARSEEVLFAHLFKMGQMMEDLLSEPQRAIPVYRRIIDKRPDHMGALFALARAAGRAGEYEVVVEALVQEAGVHAQASEKVPLLCRAAQICAERLAQEQRALDLYKEALGLEASCGAALRALVSLHQEAGRFPDMLRMLTAQLQFTKDPEKKVKLLLQMGRVSEESMRQDEKALVHYKKAFETQETSLDAISALRRTWTRMGRFEELAAFLQERLKKMQPGPERAQVALELGEIYEHRLGKLQIALTSYEAALSDQPTLLSAVNARIRVLEQRTDAKKTADAICQRAQSTEDPVARLWDKLRQAEILESSERQPDAAIAVYEDILDEHPTHTAALTSLERLYHESGDVESQKRILRLQAQNLKEASNKKGAMREALRLTENEILRKPEEGEELPLPVIPEAADVLMSLSPPDMAALRVGELAALSRPSPEDLATIDRRYIEALDSPALKSSHRTRLAEFLEPRNPIQALDKHRPALEIDGENIGSARGITRIAEAVDEAELLIEAAKIEASVVRNTLRSSRLSVRAAQLLAKGGESERAVATLRHALTVHPASVEAARALHDLLSTASEFEQLATILAAAAQDCHEPEVAAEHWIAVAKIYADEREDLPAAIAALVRIERSGVRSVPATLELAELYVRDRQWKQAVAQLNRAVSLKVENEVLLAVRLRLSEIYHEHLEQLTDATRELREVLQNEPENMGALQRLLAIQIKEKAPAAAETAQSLVNVAHGSQKAEALVALGKLLATAGKKAESIQSFASAVALIGLEPRDASAGLRALLQGEGENMKNAPATPQSGEAWAGYAKALSTFCEGSRAGGHQARAYLELSQVLGEQLKDDAKAIEALLVALKNNPGESELRIHLVSRLKKTGRAKEALPELLILLNSEPLRAETWSDLVEVYDVLGLNAEAHLATGPLVALGQGSELQKSAWASRSPQPAMLSDGAFDDAALNETLREGVSLDAIALLAQLAPLLPKVFPAELSDWGTSAREKVVPRGNHPARAAVDRISHCFGEMEIDIYPSDTADRIGIVLTDPVGIVVPAQVGGLAQSEQVCYLGRFLANVARGTHAVDALSEEQLALLLGAAVRLVDANAEVPNVHEASLQQVSKRLQKALPWLSKGRIEDAARQYAAAPVVDVSRFKRLLQLSGWRVGMILSDDIGPVAHLPQVGARLSGERAEDVNQLLALLLPFWACADSVALRQRIGLL